MSRFILKSRETSKLGTAPSVVAEWRIRGVDEHRNAMITEEPVTTCGPNGQRELTWFKELKVDRVDSIEIEVEVDELAVVNRLNMLMSTPRSIVVAECEDTKFRHVMEAVPAANNRRIAKFSVPRRLVGSYVTLSAHVVQGGASASDDGFARGAFLARTPHTERLKIRFEAPDWKEGGGLPIQWAQFAGSDVELVWRWSGLERLSDADPEIHLELNSKHEAFQSLLQSQDNARKWSRVAVAQLVAADAMFELAVVAASQVDGSALPVENGVRSAIDMVAAKIGASPADLVDDLRTVKGAMVVLSDLRKKFGQGSSLEQLIEIATRRGGAA